MPAFRAAHLAPALLLSLSCGGQVVLDADAGAVPDDPADAAAVDAGDDPPPQCNCPGSPGYAPCVKPLECCPVVAACKDPASFSCTGSSEPCP